MQTREMEAPGFVDSVSVRTVTAPELRDYIRDLAVSFYDTVNNGSPLGFMPPITIEAADTYWISLLPELRTNRRLLLVAVIENSVVGSAQIVPSRRGNSLHRAEVEKVFVSREVRGRGVGTALMNAVHDVALRHGRTLLTLNTRHGEPPHHWYKTLGYKEVGVIPGWTTGPHGERYDHVTLYKELSGK